MKCVETNYALHTGEYIDLSEKYVDYIMSKHYYGPGRTLGEATTNGEVISTIATFGCLSEEDMPYTEYERKSKNKNTTSDIPIDKNSYSETENTDDSAK